MQPELSYSVLGPLEVVRDGRILPIRAGKQRVLLATLLVSANRLVPVDELVERLWGQQTPSTARATLSTYVMRVRRVLAGSGQPLGEGPIRTRPEGYLIDVSPAKVDLGRFGQLLAQADRHPHDPERVLEALVEALGLWRGPALVDIPSESLQRDVAPRLEEQRLHALERRIDTELALRRHAELVGELTALTAEHQLRERFWHQLMLALYRSHRQSDALDAYARLRSLLIEEMGLEPSVEVRELHQRILAEDPALHHAQEPSAPDTSLGAPWLSMCQLPPDIADFVGRQELIDEAIRQLTPRPDETAVPVLALTGAPGTGKSALAVTIAHRLRTSFPDGQLFVRLTGANGGPRDPAELLGELLAGSGVGRDALPDELDARAATFRGRLADRRVLLVLDDAATASQVMSLLPGTPGSAVLVTGRRLLAGVPGGRTLRVDPLGRADALDLLARLIGADRVADDLAAARAIVGACGGLPLALRIVGARLGTRPAAGLAGLAERLADEQRRLDELQTGDLEVRAGLALSYAALSPAAGTAFRRLGLLGGIDVAAWTVGVLADDADGERLVEELLQANLLSEVRRDPTGEPRYRAHDLLAVYAAELAQADDPVASRAALRRLVEALLALADRAYASFPAVTFDDPPVEPLRLTSVLGERTLERLSGDGEAWLLAEQVQIDWAIRRCVDNGWPIDAARLLERALTHLDVQLPHRHVVDLLDVVHTAAREVGEERIAWRLAWRRAMQVATRGLTDDVLGMLDCCVDVFDRIDAKVELAYTLAALAHFRSEQERGAEALALAQRATRAAAEGGYRPGYASAVREYGSLLAQHGRYVEAVPLLEESLTLARQLGGPVDAALVLHRITRHALDNGDLDRAAEASKASLAAVADVPDRRARAYIAAMASRVASARGDGYEAVELAERARDEFASLGDRLGELAAVASLAEAHLGVGEAAEVVRLANDALPAYSDVGATRHEERLRRARDAARDLLAPPA